jgi:hypothetical protein
MTPFPRMRRIRQNFPDCLPVDIPSALSKEFMRLEDLIQPGARIAVSVGSRGIANLATIVAGLIDLLHRRGAKPFIIPAMGSHGGATPEGQLEILAGYGITEEKMGVPIRGSLEVQQVGQSAEGAPVFCSKEALSADGIILVNRVKPHTDFSGTLGSGLLKMCVIGLGKRAGATAMHVSASRYGHERVIRGMAGILLRKVPILGGVAILENQIHNTARLAALRHDEMEKGEDALLEEARALMPLLPFNEIDLLIVDRLGKNISGAGMDPNVIGRGVQGYIGTLIDDRRHSPFIRRIFVRDLTPETHGNTVGLGLADVTTARVVRAMDHRTTYINALTALTPQSAKIPIHFETDREAIAMTLASLAIDDLNNAGIVRILDTLHLSEIEISENLWMGASSRSDLSALGEPREMEFDGSDNLK